MKMELIFDDQKMQFYFFKEDLEEIVLFVVSYICKVMQQVFTVQSWFVGGSIVNYIDVTVVDYVVKVVVEKLKEVVKREFEGSQLYLEFFGEFWFF